MQFGVLQTFPRYGQICWYTLKLARLFLCTLPQAPTAERVYEPKFPYFSFSISGTPAAEVPPEAALTSGGCGQVC